MILYDYDENNPITSFESLKIYHELLKKALGGDLGKIGELMTDINDLFGSIDALMELLEKLQAGIAPVASETPPEDAKKNDIWFDLNEKVIKYHDGETWKPFGAAYL